MSASTVAGNSPSGNLRVLNAPSDAISKPIKRNKIVRYFKDPASNVMIDHEKAGESMRIANVVYNFGCLIGVLPSRSQSNEVIVLNQEKNSPSLLIFRRACVHVLWVKRDVCGGSLFVIDDFSGFQLADILLHGHCRHGHGFQRSPGS